jgi:hypothetical protein
LQAGAIQDSDIRSVVEFFSGLVQERIPTRRLLRFYAGQEVRLNPKSECSKKEPYRSIGFEEAGTVISSYPRKNVMDVEFFTDGFTGMVRGAPYEQFILHSSPGVIPPMDEDPCPECAAKAVSQCRCPKSERTCANGHTWHWKDGAVVMGAGHAKKQFCGEEAGPGTTAGASSAGAFDAQLLQLARSLNTVLRGS